MAHVPQFRSWIRRPAVIVALVVVALAVAVRAALPTVATRYTNKIINDMPGYEGHVADVDLHLWRGAYTLHDVELIQIINKQRVPVFRAPHVQLAVEWRALLHGALVGQVDFYQPRVTIYAGPAKEEQKRKADDLVDRIKELLPFNINRFAVTDGELHFQNLRAEPDVDVYLDRVRLVARNLTNSDKVSESLWATVTGEGRAMKSGEFRLQMRLDPLERRPTYQLAFDLKNLRLPELNDFLKHYLAVVARDGRLSLYAESVAEEGRFRGYVKPMVRDLDILQIKKERKGLGETIKAFFVKIIAAVFENESKEQLATRVEFSGKFENPEISVWEAVTTFLRNAFVSALPAGLEGSVAPEQVEKGRPAKK
jgi:hypothetical protein